MSVKEYVALRRCWSMFGQQLRSHNATSTWDFKHETQIKSPYKYVDLGFAVANYNKIYSEAGVKTLVKPFIKSLIVSVTIGSSASQLTFLPKLYKRNRLTEAEKRTKNTHSSRRPLSAAWHPAP